MEGLRTERVKNGVFYVEGIPLVRNDDIVKIKLEAGESELKRARLCCHRGNEDKIHEMLIVLNNGTYIRPHKHLNKSESLHVIEGLADLVLFDENGDVTDSVSLGNYSSGSVFYYKIDKPIFHTQIVRSPLFVFHEVTNGPFNKDDTVYAPWSPDESNLKARSRYINDLSQKIRKIQGKNK